MAPTLTFAKYCELVVARLYEIEQEGNVPMAEVRELMVDLDGVVPAEWPREAAQHLVESGLALDFMAQGSWEVQLNARGRLLAESGAGIIGTYQQSPQVVFTIGDGNQVSVGHGQHVTQTIQRELAKEEVTKLLDQAEAALQADTTLSAAERDDALTDVTSMRAQVAKATPNRLALRALAAGLPTSAALADIADKLRQHVG